MKNLYIVGNGFDLYHGLDTKYQSFAKFLAKKDNEVYELFLKYYGLPDISEDIVTKEEYASWATFELSLANLDYEQVLDGLTPHIQTCISQTGFRQTFRLICLYSLIQFPKPEWMFPTWKNYANNIPESLSFSYTIPPKKVDSKA